jgi:hypothetical protein
MNKRTITITLFVVSIAILAITSSSSALFDRNQEDARSTLKGLKGIGVIVSFEVDEMIRQIGLTEETIQADVELQMRSAGINVISKKEDIKKVPGFPQLVVQIVGYSTLTKGDKEKGIAFFIQTELNQRIVLVRNPDINALAGTWASSIVGLGYTDEGIATDIKNGVKDCIDGFIKAYLSVNPKREDETDKKPR